MTEFLRCQRLTLQLKRDGLDAGQVARRAVEPSTMSLLGLVRHMAEVEYGWFRRRFAGLDVPRRYQTDADQDADFNGAVADPAVVQEITFAEQFTRNHDLGFSGRGWPARGCLLAGVRPPPAKCDRACGYRAGLY